MLITGVAGSGKSSLCHELKKLGCKAYDLEEVKGLYALIDRKTGKRAKKYDNDKLDLVKQHDWICDKKKLQTLIRENSGIFFYAGAAANIDELLPLFDQIFLLKVSQKTLRKRLSMRKRPDFGRTSAVQKWMFGWMKQWEDNLQRKGAIIISVKGSIRETATSIKDMIDMSKAFKEAPRILKYTCHKTQSSSKI